MSNNMDAKSMGTYVLAIVMILVAGYMIYNSMGSRGTASVKYFYDLGNQELYTVSFDTPAPHDLGGGNMAVEAWVATCGDCGDVTEQNIVYVSKLSEAAYEVKKRNPGRGRLSDEDAMIMMTPGSLKFSTPELAKQDIWYNENTPEANRLIQEARTECDDGSRMKACLP